MSPYTCSQICLWLSIIEGLTTPVSEAEAGRLSLEHATTKILVPPMDGVLTVQDHCCLSFHARIFVRLDSVCVSSRLYMELYARRSFDRNIRATRARDWWQ